MTSRATALLLALLVPVVLLVSAGPPTADASLFAAAGERLLSTDGARVLADPSLQAGPLHLLVAGVGARVARLVGARPETGASLLGAWVVLGVLLLVERWSAARPPAARCGLLLQVGLGGALAVAVVAGQVEELLAVLLVAAAGTAVHRDRPGLAGLLVGAAACTKLWALIALAALVCLPGARDRARSALVACAVVASLHLPFLPAARTHELTWEVGGPSLVALVVPVGTPVTSWARVLQLAVAMLLVVVLLRGAQRDARLVWAVPAAVVLARLVTDPHVLPYYWAAAAVPVALAVWSARRAPAHAALAGLACTPFLLVLSSAAGPAGTVLVLLTTVGGAAVLHRAVRRPPRHADLPARLPVAA